MFFEIRKADSERGGDKTTKRAHVQFAQSLKIIWLDEAKLNDAIDSIENIKTIARSFIIYFVNTSEYKRGGKILALFSSSYHNIYTRYWTDTMEKSIAKKALRALVALSEISILNHNSDSHGRNFAANKRIYDLKIVYR